MLDFLPNRLKNAVRHVNLNYLYELRIRAEKPLRANLDGNFVFLSEYGICSEREALLPSRTEIDEILYSASEYSVYAVENQLRNGFLTGNCGERIGIAGDFVYENGKVLSVKS